MSAPSGGGGGASHSGSFKFSIGGGWAWAVLVIALLMGGCWLLGGKPEVRFDYGTPGPDAVCMEKSGLLDEQAVDIPDGGAFSMSVFQPSGIAIINKMIIFSAEGKDHIEVQWPLHLPVQVETGVWYRFTEYQRQIRLGVAVPEDADLGTVDLDGFTVTMQVTRLNSRGDIASEFPTDAIKQFVPSQDPDWNAKHRPRR